MNIQGQLKKLSFDRPAQWTNSLKFKMLIVFCAAFLGLTYCFIIKNKISNLKNLQMLEQQLSLEFEAKQASLVDLKSDEAEWNHLKTDLGWMLKKLPVKNEMPGLLEEISKTGQKVGLTFDLFAPQAEIKRDIYVELPIRLCMRGSYFQFMTFLKTIAGMTRIVSFHDLKLQVRSSKQKEGLDLSLLAKIYRYRSLA